MPRVLPGRLWMVVILTDEDAQVSMAISPLHARHIAKVTVAVSGSGMARSSKDLNLVGSTWQGTIGPLPVETERTFVGSAFDANGIVLFHGAAAGATADNTAVIMLILQQTEQPTPERQCGAGEHCTVCQL